MKRDTKNTEMISMLRKMYLANEKAKAIFDYFATRVKNSNATKTDRLFALLVQQGVGIDRKEVIEFLRGLEKANCGKYMEGRRGHQSRFEWTVGLIGVGKAAAGGAEEIGEITEDESASEELEGEMLPHDYRLRPGMVTHLELPADLTWSEATRLAEFIKTLPFERAHDA